MVTLRMVPALDRRQTMGVLTDLILATEEELAAVPDDEIQAGAT